MKANRWSALIIAVRARGKNLEARLKIDASGQLLSLLFKSSRNRSEWSPLISGVLFDSY